MKEKRKSRWQAIQNELREHRSSFIVYFVLRFFVILTMVAHFLNGQYESVFICLLTLILLLVPSIIQVRLKVELPSTLEIILLLFIFAAEILGEINAYYVRYPGWDTALHTINGFLMAAIGFSLVDLLNRDQRFSIQLSPLFLSIVAFCFSMTIGVVWEFFEFGMDMMFGLDMQKDTIVHTIASVTLDPNHSNAIYRINDIADTVVNGQSLGLGGYLDIGIIDTMKDLIVNFVGAVLFSFIGYFYVKSRGQGKFASRFIPRLKKQDNRS